MLFHFSHSRQRDVVKTSNMMPIIRKTIPAILFCSILFSTIEDNMERVGKGKKWMDAWKRKKKCMEFFPFLSGSQERKLRSKLIYNNKMIKVN